MATFCAQSKSNAGRSLSSGHRYRGNRSYESRINVKGNRFYQMIRRIAEMIGYDARYIAPMFNTYTSADFIHGAQAVPKVATIPDNMWQSVHCHYNLCLQQPFTEQSIVQRPLIFKEKSSVYIGIRVTKRLIKDQTILDQFSTTKRLYQYLNWTLRMCKVTHSMTQFQGQNGANVLLFDVELHDRRGQGLYALCITNDLVTDKSQRWQLADLLTAQQVIDILGINKYALPRGVRAASHQFASYRNMESLKALKEKQSKMELRRKVPRYTHLKCIQTGICKKNRNDQSVDDTLNVKASDFREAVLSALTNEKVDLVPIVSVVSRKPKNRKDKIEDFRFGIFPRDIARRMGCVFQELCVCSSCDLKLILLLNMMFPECSQNVLGSLHHSLTFDLHFVHFIQFVHALNHRICEFHPNHKSNFVHALCSLIQCRLFVAGPDRDELDRDRIP